jgi:hypothetical protein
MITHMCVDIRGAIWNRSFEGLKHSDGRPMTKHEAFEALCDELVKGRRVLPLSRCDNFDYEKGCLGHDEDPDTGELKHPSASSGPQS